MKWLAAALAVAVLLLQYRVWFSEDGVHSLRPVGLPIEVTRRREGSDMVWDYVGFRARLRRLPTSS